MQKQYVSTKHSETSGAQRVSIKNGTLSIDDEVLLDNINMNVQAGDFVYVIGRVGSGKSSLLKTLYAEMELDKGSIDVLGYNLMDFKRQHIPELRRQMGIIFQDFALLRRRTVEQNLDFVLRATDWKKKELRQKRIKEVLTLVGMEGRGSSYPHELSGGEQQRVAIARAMLNTPKLILADEPTGNLDAETAKSITALLHSFAEKGTAVVMITHNMSHLKHFPGRIYECADKTLREINFVQESHHNTPKD